VTERAHPGAVRVRAATPDDVDQIHAFIVGLAEYEGAPDQVTGTPELLRAGLFGGPGTDPSAEALIAELDGVAAGFALFHGTFSTWECRPGVWLEDLYVPQRFRRAGVGHALLRRLAALTLERGCARLEWHALDWNEPAIAVYHRLGARMQTEWRIMRLADDPLAALASTDHVS